MLWLGVALFAVGAIVTLALAAALGRARSAIRILRGDQLASANRLVEVEAAHTERMNTLESAFTTRITELQQANHELREAQTQAQDKLRKRSDSLGRRINGQKERVDGTRKRLDGAEQRVEGIKRLSEANREGIQEAKDRTSMLRNVIDERHKSLTVLGGEMETTRKRVSNSIIQSKADRGELIHGSRRDVSDEERSVLLEAIVPALGLDWVGERHLRYLEHAVPSLEARLRGRLAAPTASMALRSLVVMAAPDRTKLLEIGTLYGLSAAFLHEVVQPQKDEFHQIVIDPFFGYYNQDQPDLFTPIPVVEDVFVENMRRVGASSEDFDVVVGLAEDPSIRSQFDGKEFDVLVIDGDHSYEGVKRDYEKYAGLVKQGGFVIIDDYKGPSWPEVTEFVDEFVFTDDRFEIVTGELRTAVVRRR